MEMLIEKKPVQRDIQSSCCCSVDHPLLFAQKKSNTEPITIIELTVESWDSKPLVSLINHIVFDHHLFLRTEMLVLGEWIKKIMHAHGKTTIELITLYRLFQAVKYELEQHLFFVEEQVFPLLLDYEKSKSPESLQLAKCSIDEMKQAHNRIGSLLLDMNGAAANYRLPADACRAIALTYQKLQQLEDRVFKCIQVEHRTLCTRIQMFE